MVSFSSPPKHTWTVLLLIILKYHETTTQDTDEDISNFIRDCDSKIKSLMGSIKVILLNPEENQSEFLHESNKLLHVEQELNAKVSSVAIDRVKDDLLKRQLLNLKHSYLNLMSDDSLKLAVSQDLSFALNRKTICIYEDQTNCSLSYNHQIREFLTGDGNPDVLTYYWTAWHKTYAKENERLFEHFRQLVGNSEKINGSSLLSSQRYHQYENPEFLTELQDEIMKLRPLYEELHAYIRMIMRMEFGDKLISLESSMPEQFLQNVLEKIEKSNVYEKEMNRIVSDSNNAAIEAAISAANSLGDEVNSNPEHFPDLQFSYKVCTNNKRIKQREYVQAYKKLFINQYEMEMAKLPVGLNDEPCPGFKDAIFRAMTLSFTTPRYFEKVKLIKDYVYNDGMMYYHLLQTALSNIIALPVLFVKEKFIIEVLDGKIDRDFSCEYWKMMEEFSGIRPPKSVPKSELAMSFSFYECYKQTKLPEKLFSEIVGFQIYKNLCQKNNETLLQNCDFTKNPEIEKLLKKVMSLGSTKSWRDVLYLLTGERSLNIEPLLEYYNPLLIMLQNKTKLGGSVPGWGLTYKCDDEEDSSTKMP